MPQFAVPVAASQQWELCVAVMGKVRIGVSGWRYPHWRRNFYPEKLPQRAELDFAATKFRSVEINGTFYSLQRPSSFRRWADETPADFVFAIKGSRFITHMLKLRDAEQALANFVASGLLELGPKLGPILWQFSPRLRYDEERFTEFFKLLPRTHGEAAILAAKHDDRLEGRAAPAIVKPARSKTPIRHCVEFRHDSFVDPAFIALLRKHRIGLVVADTVAWPLLVDVTADFVYCRLHGSEELYVSGYESEALQVWADRIVAWATGGCAEGPRACDKKVSAKPRDVYVYFDNDAKVRAPFDALALAALVDERLSSFTE